MECGSQKGWKTPHFRLGAKLLRIRVKLSPKMGAWVAKGLKKPAHPFGSQIA